MNQQEIIQIFRETKISHLLIQTHTKWYSHKVPVEKTNSLMTFFG